MVVRRRVLHDRESGRVEELGASYIPLDIAQGTFLEEPDVVPKALFLCIEDLSGDRYVTASDRWTWRMPTSAEAMSLGMSPSAAVVHLVHVARSENGRLLEISESVWPADRIEIIDEYDVAQEAEESRGLSDI